MTGRWRVGLALLAWIAATGCEFGELTVATPEDILIVEGQVVVALEKAATSGDLGPGTTLIASAYLHRTFTDPNIAAPVGVVQITDEGSGVEIVLTEAPKAACVRFDTTGQFGVDGPPGTCYRDIISPSPFSPGARLTLEVTTSDNRVMTGTTQVPGSFSLEGLTHSVGQCRLPPDSNYPVSWTESAETWAYVGESNIFGLDTALEPQGIEAPEVLFLDGLSIGQEDTEMVFPAEFGVFDRFDLEGGLSQALQDGLPDGTRAEIAMSAGDRNWVNWERGGNFNPSGAVRIPSVFGDGTGVFGSAVRHDFEVVVSSNPSNPLPICGELEPERP
ncbi:MAG: hypothetical protein ACR2QM_17570 [Longimicrobiales bacterium]